eukprot:16220398-Heterocapsa_arctica.AAC.1
MYTKTYRQTGLLRYMTKNILLIKLSRPHKIGSRPITATPLLGLLSSMAMEPWTAHALRISVHQDGYPMEAYGRRAGDTVPT